MVANVSHVLVIGGKEDCVSQQERKPYEDDYLDLVPPVD